MSLVLTAELRMQAAQAKAELEAARRGVQGVTGATEAQTTASRGAATAATAEASAKRGNAQASLEMATANRQAAGATGNLVAQFNDIGMMMAAGQNPLQLAIQQGTQITQVLGGQGAAGAVGMLKNAFVQALNPMNLLFIAGLAGGAAMIQWLTGATESARGFDEAVSDLSERADSYIDVAERARSKTAELRAEFGDAAVAAREMFADMAERELRELIREVTAASDALQAQIGIFEGAEFGTGNQKALADLFDLSIWSRDARKEINSVLQAFETLDSAGTLEEQIAAAEQLKARFQEAAMASGEISAAEDAILGPLDAMIQKLMAARAEQEGTRSEFEATVPEVTALNASIDAMAGNLAVMSGISISGVFTNAQGPANALLGIVDGIVGRMATVAQGIELYGRGNFMVGADGSLYAQGTFQDGGMDAAARGESLKRPNPYGKVAGGAAGVYRPPPGGGGGGGAARDEADALQELITSLEGEIDALRVTDPIQKEMLQHREALAGATEAERLKVEELIATREREMAVTESLQFAAESAGNALIDALMGADDAGQKLIQTLIKAVLQAAILGQGPLGGLFGNTGIGNLIIGAIGGGRAEGGMIYGPGTSTSDSILTPLSNGEYVVNAKATAKNRQLLEAINAGSPVPGFATGGYVGGPGRATGGQDAGSGFIAHINLAGARGDREIEEASYKGMQRALREYDRAALPESVKRVSGDPRRIG